MKNRFTMIALLRGVNVSGKNTIKMDSLRNALSDKGFESINTYIQSGNIVFNSKNDDRILIEKTIQATIKEHFGHDVSLLVISSDRLNEIIENHPFKGLAARDETFIHVTFTANTIDASSCEMWMEQLINGEEYFCSTKCIYFYCPNGYGNFKLTNSFIEKKLRTIATTRNWKTTLKLQEMAIAISAK